MTKKITSTTKKITSITKKDEKIIYEALLKKYSESKSNYEKKRLLLCLAVQIKYIS